MQFKQWLESSTRQPYVYHTTYYRNLDSISDNGLDYEENGGANFTKPWLQTHSAQGNFFVTDTQNIKWWIHVLEYQASDKSDNIDEDGLIPFILRFRLNPKKHLSDKHQETPSDALTACKIPPMGIQVWDGIKWWPIAYWGNINPQNFLDSDNDNIFVREDYPIPKY